MHSEGSFLPFVTSPIAAVFLLIALYSAVMTVRKNRKTARQAK
jgi:putative tricarboxylic transport membrane protein